MKNAFISKQQLFWGWKLSVFLLSCFTSYKTNTASQREETITVFYPSFLTTNLYIHLHLLSDTTASSATWQLASYKTILTEKLQVEKVEKTPLPVCLCEEGGGLAGYSCISWKQALVLWLPEGPK